MSSGSVEPPAITFAVPYYRGLNDLRRAIESVFRQTSKSWCLIVVDDGSEEPAECLVSQYRDPRVSYVRNPRNLGMAANWNRCLDLATTPLVTILHADDELLPNYTDMMIRADQQDRFAVAFFCRAVVMNARNRPIFSFPDRIKDRLAGWSTALNHLAGPKGIARLLRGCFVMCPTMCYRVDRLANRRFSERWKMVLDLDFFTRLLAEGESIVGLPVEAYAYRRHENHATAAYNENLLRFHEEAALYEEIASEGRRRGWDEVAKVGTAKRIVKLHLLFRTLGAFVQGRFKTARERLALLFQLCAPRTRRDGPCTLR